MIEILLLVSALCIDEMVATLAYGANGIKVHFREILVMNIISSGFLGVALFLGSILQGLISQGMAQAIGFISLFLLGMVKLLDYSIKAYINKHTPIWKNISFTFSRLKFIISIYGNPVEADEDDSHTLSLKETIFLSCAMSIDSMVAGTLAAFLDINKILTVFMAFAVGIVFAQAGYLSGHKLSNKCNKDLSWLSGALLILLGFVRLIS